MLTGNKGEWSEVYVFLKLLADGKLYAADAKLDKIEKVFYPIIKILREEINKKREYVLNGEVIVVDGNSNVIIVKVPISDFIAKSKKLFSELKTATGRSFGFPDIENYLNKIDVHSLTAVSTDKSDIKIVVHDLHTGQKPTLGFSIKSMIGSESTLFNPGNTTNFIYEIEGPNLDKIDIKEVNEITEEPIITSRINYLISKGLNIKFVDIQSKNLKLNLQLIDSNLPEILSYLLLYRYTESRSLLRDLLQIIEEKNPLNFDTEFDHPFYEYKIKNFLTDSALGMTPSRAWTGQYDATGGIIIVKEDGELVCYHIYNRNEFQEYLIDNTKLEQASRTRYEFGNLYEEGNRKLIKLNLQVRFN